MREIKFRGFHKKEDGPHIAIIAGKPVRGEWVYGCYTYSKKAERHLIWIQSEDNTEFWHTYPFEVYPSTVGQYTGLHDKNGKEIYEGDIIKAKTFNYPLCIEWDRGECAFVMRSTHSGATYGFMWEIEVIGNAHDNPDLLK